jgi:ABC-type molybdate transport system permease subunit
VPLAIYTAVQTGEETTGLLLVGILTALSCLVIVAANRLGARAT